MTTDDGQEFVFTVQLDTVEGESVGVVGNCPELGNWMQKKALMLNKVSESMEGQTWSASVIIPEVDIVEYRYFVCIILEPKADLLQTEVVIRRWETHLQPRIAGLNGEKHTKTEQFGYIGNDWKVESGWLTAESVIQLKLYNNPIQLWKAEYMNKLVYVKVTPVDLERRNSSAIEDESTDDNEYTPPAASWPIVEVAVMNDHACEFRLQHQWGLVYYPDDFIIYKAQMLRPDTIKDKMS